MRSYTKYQQQVIKELQLTLTDRDFKYSKAQNNHLKIIIEGVKSPLFTSATPSDCRSFQAFMSEVRCKIRESEKDKDDKEETKKPIIIKKDETPSNIDTVISLTLEQLNKAKDRIIESEADCIQSKRDAHAVIDRRRELVINTLKKAAKQKNIKLKGSDTKKIMREVTKQFYCALPNIKDYTTPKDVADDKKEGHSALNLNAIVKASIPKKTMSIISDQSNSKDDATCEEKNIAICEIKLLSDQDLRKELIKLQSRELSSLLTVVEIAQEQQYGENLSTVISMIDKFGIDVTDIVNAKK
ncbi:hypothetical protein [Photobacterium kishitanii]|uniref:Uncharacterized protein n=1 Tax=Photobacterium kishitanii TaxID=318456 RepID=A0A2T3KLH0_9GAMM|nr:hypothetical protein [Photobacterium kishitanii]PSV00565.1 hypothetical protein C9J27_05365 [Photobacterium kishitanii]